MTQQEIIEGNKLIAEFMGFKPEPSHSEDTSIPSFYYHSSWDWLMTVVEKIPKLNPNSGKLWFEYQISRYHCRIWSNEGVEIKNNWDTTIGATWQTVVDFIKWYNQNSKA